MNDNRQWLEGDANLCTAFALLALSHCNEKPADTKNAVTKPATKPTAKPTAKPKAK